MARFTVMFETDSAAFKDGYAGRAEIEAVLRKLATRVWESYDEEGLIRDSNGNTIGSWTYERDGAVWRPLTER